MTDPNPYEPPLPAPPDPPVGKLVCIGQFPTAAAAQVVRGMLEAAGVRACLEGAVTNEMLWHLGPGISGVKVMVLDDQVEKALSLLADSERELSEETAEGAPDFDDDLDRDEEEEEDEDDRVTLGGDSPAAAARRALKAAVVGIVLCPPALHLYSLYLLASHDLLLPRSREHVLWRAYLALVIDLAALGAVALWIFILWLDVSQR